MRISDWSSDVCSSDLFAAPQASLGLFAPGSTVPVLLDGREDRPVTGRVRGVVPSADPATRRYTVEVVLPADRGIMPGMFGRVRLPSVGDQGTRGSRSEERRVGKGGVSKCRYRGSHAH